MGMWQYAFSSLKEGRQLLYYVYKNCCHLFDPSHSQVAHAEEMSAPNANMHIEGKHNCLFLLYLVKKKNTTAFFFFPLLRNKVGALRYPSVSKTVVCTVDIVFVAAASLLCYQRGVKLSAADYITLSKQRSWAQDLFFVSFSHPYQRCCVCTTHA